MVKLIEANVIDNASVYGVAQKSYTVDGVSGQDYATALTVAAFREATAIEASASSFMAVVRLRQKKVTDLGDVLATLAMGMASLKTKDTSRKDLTARSEQMDEGLQRAKRICESYGITLNVKEDVVVGEGRYCMTRGDLMTSQDEIQYKLDVEDNNLQQDMVSLQGLVSKRDSAFSTAQKIVSKSLKASDATIGNIS